jgi:HSP20 family protein
MSLDVLRPASSYFQDWLPDVDCFDTLNGIRIKAELPGCVKENVKIEFRDGNLVLSGSREPKLIPDGTVLVRERNFGKFSRDIFLPNGCQVDQIQARFDEGVLDIFVPRLESMVPKRIQVE